jgi:tetratricopeptide (TPR) repeat protein
LFFAPALGLLSLTLLLGGRPPARPAKKSVPPRTPAVVREPAAVLAALLVLVLVGAGPALDLLRQANEAFEAGDYARAVELYRQAEQRATDPGLVAFNKAAALYRLEQYSEAAQHYRRCLDDAAGPRRARALYDLATCLVQAAKDKDARQLEEAVACFRECRKLVPEGSELFVNAGENLELARLLWAKARANPSQPPPGSENENPEQPEAKDPRQDGSEPNGSAQAGGSDRQELSKGQSDGGERPGEMNRQPTPGRGNLQTLPDTDELVPLPPEDAAAYLEQVAARIRHENQEHLRATTAAVAGVRDW